MDVYRTAQFIALVEDFDLEKQVSELEQKIQSCETYFEVGKLFDGAYPYLKRRQGKFRIIGQVKSVANKSIQIFVFYRIFERANKEYLEFLRYKGEPRGDKLVQQGFEEQVAEEWARSKQIKMKVYNPLPPKLRPWIEPLEELSVGKTRTEFHVQELDTWTQSVYENFIEAEEGLRSLCSLVVKILDSDVNNAEIGKINVSEPDLASSCTIVWAKKSATEVALLHASVLRPDSETLEIAKKSVEDPEYRSRVKRAYFSIVAVEYELWKNIQKQEGGNIFLSQDEIETLAKMNGSDQNESLPSILSGRAGSGKSTMLAYVFAALLWKKAKYDLEGTPIYISYNQKLLTSSRDLILLLLSANGEFGEQVENSTSDAKIRLQKIKAEAEKYFFTFHGFLLSFLNETDREKFNEAKRVDFNDFKRAYLGGKSILKPFQNLSIRKAISPERAWFIIRQFIKGSLNEDGFYGDDAVAELNANYEELFTKDQQGILFDDIEEVYKKVYEAWYKPDIDSSGLWDDQDLVNESYLASLYSQNKNRNFTAIVCDESQDFTPRELRFIVRASELLKYDLDKEHRVVLPYLLAGDSLQTLSPTGFRWEAVTSILYEEIFASSGLEVKAQKIQLSLNYRSVRPVVDFCNFIQLTRKGLFKNIEKEIQHQVAWDNSPSVRPKFFRLNENISQTELADLIKKTNTFFLIPCEESGEVDFISEDPILSQLFPGVSDDNLPETVLSATAAKGLEFANICLYNFGLQFQKEAFDFKRSENNFALEFFFNKLYVAASRSQRSLTVIETGNTGKPGDKTNFWDRFLSSIDQPNNQPRELIELVEKFPNFREHVEFLEYGLSGSWNDTTSKVSVKEADNFYNSGKDNKDPRQISRAANLYRRIGGSRNLNRALECDALYLKFNEQLEAAGRAFEELGDLKQAWQIYFSSANLWKHANELSERMTDLSPVEVALVRFMVSKSDDQKTLMMFLAELEKFSSSNKRVVLTRPWLSAQNEIVERLRKLLSSVDALISIDEIISRLENITQRDFVGLRPLLGEAHYLTKNWVEALRVWANTNLNDKDLEKHRALAKARNRGFPDGLRELSSANFKSEVIEIWREYGSSKDSLWIAEVIPAMQNLRLFEDLLQLCINEHKVEKAVTAFQELVKVDLTAAQTYILSLITECSKNYEYFGNLPLFFDYAKQSGQMNIKELCEIVLINAVKVWDDPQNFGYQQTELQSYQSNLLRVGYGLGQREAFTKIVGLYNPSREEKQLDPRWWGLCWELTGDWQRAKDFYLQYVDANDKPQIMTSSRSGVIRSLFRNIKYQKEELGKQSLARESQNEFTAKLGLWGFTESDRLAYLQPKKLGNTVPYFVEPSKSGEFTEDGDFGPFSWKTTNKTIRLEFDQTNLALSWRIELEKLTVVSNSGPLTKDDDGCYRFGAADWRVEIRFSRDDLKISLKGSFESLPSNKALKFKLK